MPLLDGLSGKPPALGATPEFLLAYPTGWRPFGSLGESGSGGVPGASPWPVRRRSCWVF